MFLYQTVHISSRLEDDHPISRHATLDALVDYSILMADYPHPPMRQPYNTLHVCSHHFARSWGGKLTYSRQDTGARSRMFYEALQKRRRFLLMQCWKRSRERSLQSPTFTGTMEGCVSPLAFEGERMFRNLLQHVTGLVHTLRQRFQQSPEPAKGKPLTTAKSKKLTKRKKSPGRVVKKA